VHDQTIDASLFYTKPKWSNDVKEFLKIGQIRAHYLYNKSKNWLEE
jgi:hypothetical protein